MSGPAGINSFGKSRDADLAMHPTVKPLAFVAYAILHYSKRKGSSGTTLDARDRSGRRGYAIALDPRPAT